MSKTLNRVISICLVVALMCGIFLTPIAQPKADASIAIATTGMIAAGVTLLTMLGITFASTGAAEKASKAIVEGSKDIHDWVKRIIPGPSGDPDKNTLMMDAAATGGLALFVNKAKELFGNKKKSGTVSVPDDEFYMYQNVRYFTDLRYSDRPEHYLYDRIMYFSTSEENAVVVNSPNGHVYKYWIEEPSEHNSTVTMMSSCDGVVCTVTDGYGALSLETSLNFDQWIRYGFGFYLYTSDGVSYLVPYLAGCFETNRHFKEYRSNAYTTRINEVRYLSASSKWLGILYAPISGNVTPATTQVPYQNVSPYEMSIIYNALAEKLEKGNITIDYTDTLDQIENHSDEQLNISQEQLLKEAEIQKTLEEIKAGQGDGTTQLEEQDMDIPEAPDLTCKFPFCIPFDLIALVGALNAKPKDPKWEIPFHVESLGFDDSIGLDLTKFEPVSDVLRVIITIMFLLGLIVVTRKMIKG